MFGKIRLRGLARLSPGQGSSGARARPYLSGFRWSLWRFSALPCAQCSQAAVGRRSQSHASSEVFYFPNCSRESLPNLSCLDCECLLTWAAEMMIHSILRIVKYLGHLVRDRRGFLALPLLCLPNSPQARFCHRCAASAGLGFHSLL